MEWLVKGAMMTRNLTGKTMILSGGSRGIGLSIALRAARDGANIALVAKTGEPHPKLEGTVYTAAKAIEEAGGKALPIVGDVRRDDDVLRAVEQTVAQFGGIDICLNNASAIDLGASTDLDMKKYDLMQDINVRGTFLLSRTCIPHLAASDNPHVLTLSPPLNLSPHWMGKHVGYMLSKYGMTLCALGLAAELADRGIASNTLWPRTYIATAAVINLLGGVEQAARGRTPQIVADAAYAIFTQPAADLTGRTLMDDDVLRAAGQHDLDRYSVVPGLTDLDMDIFVD